MNINIPVIDIKDVASCYNQSIEPSEKFFEISNQLLSALQEWGFVYIEGHGIKSSIINDIFNVSKQYFQLPAEVKSKQLYKKKKGNVCYIPSHLEVFNTKEKVQESVNLDFKEALDFIPTTTNELLNSLPSAHLLEQFFSECKNLTYTILHLLNLGWPAFKFSVAHQCIGDIKKNLSTLRLLHYPAISSEESSDKRIVGCSGHTDYGTLTFLFQDHVGGLQVQTQSGDFVPVTPIENTIVLNAADLLERWSGGLIKSAMHRVMLSTETSQARQSIAFFCQPDNNITVSCLDGSDRYSPVNTLEYLEDKFNQSCPDDRL